MIRKNCENCGKFYWSRESHNRRYCSRKCSNEGFSKEKNVDNVCRNCVECGKIFKVKPYKDQKLCSRKCAQSHRKHSRNGRYFECVVCGNEFYRNKGSIEYSEKNNSEINYCSKECYFKDVKNGNTFECEQCGEEFYRSKGQIKSTHKKGSKIKFCSIECQLEYYNRELYPNTKDFRKKILARKEIEKLADSYVKNLLTQNNCLKAKYIPQEIVDVKRQNLKIKRLIRNKNQ